MRAVPGRRAGVVQGRSVHQDPSRGLGLLLAGALAAALGVAGLQAVSAPPAEAATTATVQAVGTLVTHTNQPSMQQESVTVLSAAVGDVLAVAVETKFPGTPSFSVSGVAGGGVSTWHRALAFLTLDGFHGQELWWGPVTVAGSQPLTVSYTSGSTAGTNESATSVDVQQFSSSAGISTVWAADGTGKVDDGNIATTLNYPTLTPSSTPAAYFGYLAVPNSVSPGSSAGVVYQTDARYNQVVYDTAVTGTITPTARSSAQTYASIGMLLAATTGTTTDSTPPSTPTGLTVSGTPTTSSVALSWNAATDNTGGSGLAGYRIYRNGSTTPLTSTPVTTTSYTDTTVTAATTYSYTVTAVDRAGNQSAPSTAATATTPAASGTGTGTGTGGSTTLTNSGFEAGSLSGWTTSGPAAGVTTTAHTGGYSALLGATTPTSGDSSIAQTFTAPTGSPSLSFWWRGYCPDTVQYDWATATLTDTTTGATTTPLPKTCATTSWKQVTTTLTGGHTYTLTLTSHDENAPGDATYTRYDDVTVG